MKISEEYGVQNFSKPYEVPRFRIVRKSTGEVVDDAQGYGYRSAANAFRALSYKLNRKERAQTAIKVAEFIKDNKSLLDNLRKELRRCGESVDSIMFYAIKDNEKISEKRALKEAYSSFWAEFEKLGGTIPEDTLFRFRLEQKFYRKKEKS